MNFNTDFYRQNRKILDEKFSYFGLDLVPENNLEVIVGDICDSEFLEHRLGAIDAFDVVYSNNVFEHLHDPFTAAKNMWRMCKLGGLLVTIVPFSQRFHASPDDYLRFTHRGVEEIFQRAGSVIIHESGYDIVGRRNNRQGSGLNFDLVPADRFGARREK